MIINENKKALPDIKPRMDLRRYESYLLKFIDHPIEEGKILFYGSSGFTRWRNKEKSGTVLEKAVVGKSGKTECVNHGFGGSSMHELCYYYDIAVKPFKPRVLVISAFINDLDCDYTDEEIMTFLNWLLDTAREDFPGIRFYVTDYRPNAKEHTDEEINRLLGLNQKIRDYVNAHPDTGFIEISKEPYFYKDQKDVGSYRNVREDLFVEDKMHYTPECYSYFAETFKRALKDELS